MCHEKISVLQMPFKSNEEQRIYKRGWYRRNTVKVKAEVMARKRKLAVRLQVYKEELQCELCLEDTACCLDFHHPDDNKDNAVADMPWHGFGWDKILQEINKCMVLCRNCHAKVHVGIVSTVTR